MKGYFFVITTPLRGSLTVACHCSLCTNISHFFCKTNVDNSSVTRNGHTPTSSIQSLLFNSVQSQNYRVNKHFLFQYSFSFSVSRLESFPKTCQNKHDGSPRKLNTESDLYFSFILIFYSQLVSADSLRHSADELHGHSFCEYICLPEVIAKQAISEFLKLSLLTL